MASVQDDLWREYYARRNRARVTLLAIPIVLYLLLTHVPESWLDKLNDLPLPIRITVVFILIGLATVGFAAPVLKWAVWRCPRCGEKFVQPKTQFGAIPMLSLIAWQLVFGRRCARCKLPCGADPTYPPD